MASGKPAERRRAVSGAPGCEGQAAGHSVALCPGRMGTQRFQSGTGSETGREERYPRLRVKPLGELRLKLENIKIESVVTQWLILPKISPDARAGALLISLESSFYILCLSTQK